MPAKRKGSRKNRRIKFSESNYVDKYYMKGRKGIIPIKLESIDDLYMKPDYIQKELSEDICTYIEKVAYMIPLHTDIILEIHCPEISEEMQDRIKKTFKNNYGMKIDEDDYNIGVVNKRSQLFALVGIVLLIFNVIFEKYIFSVLANFLNIVWWVAIWNMIELQLIENGKIKWQRSNNLQLYDADVTFVFDNGKIQEK